MRISVIGIGYVGAVTSACLCKDGHSVIALDNTPSKVTLLNQGMSPIIEKGLAENIKKHVDSGALKATTNVKEAIQETDITLICVGTPSRENGSLDLSYIQKVCQDIGEILKNKDDFHVVVLRSTMLPGSAEDICQPILESASRKKAGIDFGFGNNPEFLREGSAIYDYFNPPKIVVGANDLKSSETIMALYEGIEAPRITTEIKIAEGVKYADNAWHAMKIGFANEVGNIMDVCGVDSHKVMDIFCQDQKLNISKAYLKPGFAFGGSCLPKDVRALRSKADELTLDTPLFDALLTANDNQVERAFNKIKARGKKNIVLLGLSFKAGTDDLRESPLVTLADQLINNGYKIKIYDPNVFAAQQVESPTHFYLKDSIPHIAERLIETTEDALQDAELFIIGNNDPQFLNVIADDKDETIEILDLVRISPEIEKRKGYNGICW